MRNIIRDIEENCPDCSCSVEKTVKFLHNRGDFTYTSNLYREIWFFYTEALETRTKKEARDLTLEMFRISFETFRRVRKWWNKGNS